MPANAKAKPLKPHKYQQQIDHEAITIMTTSTDPHEREAEAIGVWMDAHPEGCIPAESITVKDDFDTGSGVASATITKVRGSGPRGIQKSFTACGVLKKKFDRMTPADHAAMKAYLERRAKGRKPRPPQLEGFEDSLMFDLLAEYALAQYAKEKKPPRS